MLIPNQTDHTNNSIIYQQCNQKSGQRAAEKTWKELALNEKHQCSCAYNISNVSPKGGFHFNSNDGASW